MDNKDGGTIYDLQMELGTADDAQDIGCEVIVCRPEECEPFIGLQVADETDEALVYLTPGEADRLSEALATAANRSRNHHRDCKQGAM